MDTSLSINETILALRNSGMWNKRSDIMIPNLSWGLLPYEADFVVVTKSGYLTEVEIKRSWSDFLADFKKKHNHEAEQVYYFYYCVPEQIVSKVKEYLTEQGLERAVLSYNERGGIKREPFGYNTLNGKHRKLFIEEQLTITRLGQLRFWNLLEAQYSQTDK